MSTDNKSAEKTGRRPKRRKQRKPRKPPLVGRIDAGALYTREGAERFGGLGGTMLMNARRSGIVKPIQVGRRMYYRGDELIEWICSHREGQGDGEE